MNAGNGNSAAAFEMQRRRFMAAAAAGDFLAAGLAAQAVLRFQPGNVGVMADYAFALMRQRRHEEAHRMYLRVYAANGGRVAPGKTWLDGLTEVCGWLGRADDVRRYGNESLAQADARLGGGPAIAARGVPPAFDPEARERHIISYSLFGAIPRYCESAVKNVEVAADLFASWRCRVYHDDTVPPAVRERLSAAGAQLVDMTGPAGAGVHPLMWRFLVADDPHVSRFLVRDADALLSEREQAAVEAWTRSACWFHHMRDYFTHTELILAGMWGACRGLLPPLRPMMKAWLRTQRELTRFADQVFLRERVWPTLRQSVLTHDDVFGFHGARPFPPHAPIRWRSNRFHVGSNAATASIRGASTHPDGATQSWSIRDPQGRVTCAYDSIVEGGHWQADLPFFLTEAIAQQQLTVHCV